MLRSATSRLIQSWLLPRESWYENLHDEGLSRCFINQNVVLAIRPWKLKKPTIRMEQTAPAILAGHIAHGGYTRSLKLDIQEFPRSSD